MDIGRGMPIALSFAALGTGAFLLAQASAAPSGPRVEVRPRCFVQHGRRAPAPGRLVVSGFPPSVDLTIQFGRARPQHGSYFTDDSGAFSSPLDPGRLGRAVQAVRAVTVRGGGRTARTTYALTLSPGADFAPAHGTLASKVRFRVWGFGADGRRRTVYVHYVQGGRTMQTVRLGRTGGLCGLLRSPRRPLFPFKPARGCWYLHFDSHARYRARPRGPHATNPVGVGVPVSRC